MSHKFFNGYFIHQSNCPPDFIPEGSKPFISMDVGKDEDLTCIAKGIVEENGIITLQEFEFYDNKGNKVEL